MITDMGIHGLMSAVAAAGVALPLGTPGGYDTGSSLLPNRSLSVLYH
jgi:hypothetical protein